MGWKIVWEPDFLRMQNYFIPSTTTILKNWISESAFHGKNT